MKTPHAEKIQLQAAIGEAIRKRRTDAGIARRQLALDIGVSDSTLQKIEDGQQPPTAYNLYKLAEVFDTQVDALMPVLTRIGT